MASVDVEQSDIEVDLTTLLDQGGLQPSSSMSFPAPTPEEIQHALQQRRLLNSDGSHRAAPVSTTSKKYKYRKDSKPKGTDAKIIFCSVFGILTMISLLLITIYTIKSTAQPVPSLYRHMSTFGPKYRVDEHNADDQTSKSQFFPSVWLPTVDRSTIVETILSQTQTEMWISTNVLHNFEKASNPDTTTSASAPITNPPVLTESQLNEFVSMDYPSTSNVFISQQPQPTSFPMVLPASKAPVNTYIDTQFTPVEPYYMIQFYAHWCGHCRRFSPHAESLAHTLNAANPQSPIRMLRVHCADASPGFGQQLCQGLSIGGYPSLYIASARTWLWVLAQIMPEFHQRAQMWYVRSRGSQPEPGQETVDVKDVHLKPLLKEILESLLTKVPGSASTAQLTIDWVNEWLAGQYMDNLNTNRDQYYSSFQSGKNSGEPFKLLRAAAHNTFKVYADYFQQYSDVLVPKQRQSAGSTGDKDISFRIDDYTYAQLAAMTEDERKVLYFEKLRKASDYHFDPTNATDLAKWKQVGLPLDDQIAFSMFSKSMLEGTDFFKNYKPTRYYDYLINFTVRPSLLAGLQAGMAVTVPVKYTVLTEEQLREEMLKDVSSESDSSRASSGLKTPNQLVFKNGYPDQANVLDKMLYWSIALRESIPQCQRVQVLEAGTANDGSASSKAEIQSKMTHVESLVEMMKQQLKEYAPAKYARVPDELLFASNPSNQSSGVPNQAERVRDAPTDKRGEYLQSQTCFESIFDMLDMLCTLTSKSPISAETSPQNYKSKYGKTNMDRQCQASFCQLRDTLTQYIAPPQYTQQLYRIHTLTGLPAPTIQGHFDPSAQTTTTNSKPAAATQEQFPGNWELCYQPWSYWDGLDWQQCQGSLPYTRGYTCALWLNLHSLSAALDHQIEAKTLPVPKPLPPVPQLNQTEPTSPSLAPIPGPSKFALIIRSYFNHFFPCAECQQHFLDYSNELPFLLSMTNKVPFMSSLPLPGSNASKQQEKGFGMGYRPKELKPGEKEERTLDEIHDEFDNSRPRRTLGGYTAHKFIPLWLWNTHNIVNQRLAGVEKEFAAADPVFPKIYFPLHSKCPQCRDELYSMCSTTSNTGSSGSAQKSDKALSHNCLWDDHWKYDQVYSYLVDFYTPAH